MKIAIIGGDLRQIYAAKYLKQNFDVRIYGFDEVFDDVKDCLKISLHDAAQGADAVILGVPSTDGDYICAKNFSGKIKIEELINSMTVGQILLGGRLSYQIKELCEEKAIKFFDYFEREELTVLNTIATAEGAIEIAMKETPYTLHGAKTLVCGFGNVGKTLAKLLLSLGCEVYCTYRKQKDKSWIEVLGGKPVEAKLIKSAAENANIIFNTVPHKIISADILENISNNTVIIDLASKPGGVDFEAAQRLNKKVIWALSIPGKVAPQTAGKVISDTIINILSE